VVTHTKLIAAAEASRPDPFQRRDAEEVGWLYDWAEERDDSVDVLVSILRLHPHSEGRVMETCRTCTDWSDRSDGAPFDVNWPCPTVQIVIDVLTGWGALDER
jgi:hypothetical protein